MIRKRVRKLGIRQLLPGYPVLIKRGSAFQAGVLPFFAPHGSRKPLRIKDPDRLVQPFPNHPDGGDEIGVAGDNYSDLVGSLKPVRQQVRGEVDIASLLLGLEDFDGGRRGRNRFGGLSFTAL